MKEARKKMKRKEGKDGERRKGKGREKSGKRTKYLYGCVTE